MITAVLAQSPSMPETDAAAVFPEIARWRAAFQAGDLLQIKAIFGGLGDPDSCSYAVRLLSEIPGSEGCFERLARSGTAGSLGEVLLASRHIQLGWEVRTAQRAENVSREQFDSFHEHLRTAERILIDVTAREPDNVPAWDLRMITVRGLELGHSEARRRYQQVAKWRPHHYPAQAQLLQQLCPKWSGSWDEMFQYARECANAAPPGSVNPVLVVEAHLERWRDEPAGDDIAYLRQPEVQQEIVAAATRSVLHPAFRRNYRWYSAHGFFALAYSLVGDHGKAARHFRMLDNYMAKTPWDYLGDSDAWFSKYQQEALAGAQT